MNADTETKPVDLKKLRKRIKGRERRFKAASPAGKRVLIAKDVLEQLELGKIKASEGTWWENMPESYRGAYNSTGQWTILEDYGDRDLRDLILEQGEDYRCSACAVGAMFYCSVLRKDDLTRGEARARYEFMSEYMSGFFEQTQLWLIENAFERGAGCSSPGTVVTDELLHSRRVAVEFGYRFSTASERMVAIMKNIIANKGEFKP